MRRFPLLLLFCLTIHYIRGFHVPSVTIQHHVSPLRRVHTQDRMTPLSPSSQCIQHRQQDTVHSIHRYMRLGASSTTSITTAKDSDGSSKPPSFLSVLWRFTRPHTIIGSALAIPSLHILAAKTYGAAFSVQSLTSMVYAMIPALLMNLYITGLNQVTDVDIDKINKPTLPIASGDLSMKNGIITILLALFGSLIMGFAHPVFGTEGLNVALWMSGILGTLYSLEPFRLKRFPFLAAICIVSVRGAVINAGFFAHAKAAALGVNGSVWKSLTTDPSCMLSSLYFAIFGIVIALTKDVPDVRGDEIANVRTFSVRLGQKAVFSGMHRLLTSLFIVVGGAFIRGAYMATTTAATTSASSSLTVVRLGRALVALSAFLAGWSVQREAAPVDPTNPKEVYEFYMHLWKLFYLSYFVLPFAR